MSMARYEGISAVPRVLDERCCILGCRHRLCRLCRLRYGIKEAIAADLSSGPPMLKAASIASIFSSSDS